MIKKYKQYNEGLTDYMKPKSEEEVKEAQNTFISKLKNRIDNADIEVEFETVLGGLIDVVIQISNTGEVIKEMINDGIIDEVELLYLMLSNFTGPHKRYFIKMKPDIIDRLFKVIEENKDKLDKIDLW